MYIYFITRFISFILSFFSLVLFLFCYAHYGKENDAKDFSHYYLLSLSLFTLSPVSFPSFHLHSISLSLSLVPLITVWVFSSFFSCLQLIHLRSSFVHSSLHMHADFRQPRFPCSLFTLHVFYLPTRFADVCLYVFLVSRVCRLVCPPFSLGINITAHTRRRDLKRR